MLPNGKISISTDNTIAQTGLVRFVHVPACLSAPPSSRKQAMKTTSPPGAPRPFSPGSPSKEPAPRAFPSLQNLTAMVGLSTVLALVLVLLLAGPNFA